MNPFDALLNPDDEITKKIVLTPQEQEEYFSSAEPYACSHSWKLYQGLNESFEYCQFCDQKRPAQKS